MTKTLHIFFKGLCTFSLTQMQPAVQHQKQFFASKVNMQKTLPWHQESLFQTTFTFHVAGYPLPGFSNVFLPQHVISLSFKWHFEKRYH